MKDRIFKNWKSSLLGIMFLVFGGAAVFAKVATFNEFVAFIPFCLTFIYVKDSIFKRKCNDEAS